MLYNTLRNVPLSCDLVMFNLRDDVHGPRIHGSSGSIDPHFFRLWVRIWRLTPHVLSCSLVPNLQLQLFIHSFIHYTPRQLAAQCIVIGPVCVFSGGVRTLLQPARVQCLRLSERYFHSFKYSFIQLLLFNSPQILIVPKDLKLKSNNNIREGRKGREQGKKGRGCPVFPEPTCRP